MASSSISEPFVLATYSSSSRSKLPQRSAGVYASSHQKASSSDGYVTVAAQADGVHVLDVSNLHPVISHTLGPSASFQCPPLSVASSSSRTATYAILSASPELSSAEESGRTLWAWEDDSSVQEKKKAKRTKLLSAGQAAHDIHSCNGRILVVSTAGYVSLIDPESLETKSTNSPPTSPFFQVVRSWLLSSSQSSAIVVMLGSKVSKTAHLRILAIDEADSISENAEHEISIDSEDILDTSCSPAGVLSILTRDGTWHSYRLEGDSLIDLSPPLPLCISSTPLSTALLALTSSHVLLATVSAQEINILLWDLQFAVLLASHILPVPSTLSSTTWHLRLIQGSHSQNRKSKTHTVVGQAVLIISSVPADPPTKKHQVKASDSSEQKIMSVLLVVPYTVPTQSTIAAAIGRGAAGKKWLKSNAALAAASTSHKNAEDVAREKLLTTMRTAISGGRAQAAVAAFMKWAPKEGQANASTLDYNFVKEMSESVLLPSSDSKAAAAYASEVVRYLLERRLVCSSMISTSGGLLGALRLRGDWKSVELAFSRVPDLTESEIVETLRVVIAHERPSSAPDAMQVDQPPSADSPLPLAIYLDRLTNYATSRSQLLLAFRRHLQDPEDVTRVLRVLEVWVGRRGAMDENLLPSNKELKRTKQGVWVIAGKKGGKDKEQDVPPLEKIIALLQTLLDATFLVLLPHKPAHKSLRALRTLLNPEMTFARVVEHLRGPLEPFAIAQEKAVKESLISPQERDRERQKGDWRQTRKAGAAGADIGMYQLEELVI